MAETATTDTTQDSTVLNTKPAEPIAADKTMYDKTPVSDTTTVKEQLEKIASDKAATDKVAADKEASDKAAADKAAADANTSKDTKQDDKTTPAKVPATSTDYDLKLPDGSPLSPEDLAQTLKDAKEKGLSKEQAEATLTTKDQAVRQVLIRQNDAFKAEKASWLSKLEKDPEIGGENYAHNIEIASRAWEKLASPELKFLASEKQSGLGNHPELIRLMYRVGQMMAEDKIVRGTTGPLPGKKSREDIMYGNPKSSAEAMV